MTRTGGNQTAISVDSNEKHQPKVKDVLGVDARKVAALIVIGHRLYKQGKLPGASTIFEGLAVLDSSSHYIHGILGSIYQKQQNFDRALIRYNNAIALFPDDVNALANRGEILVQLGKFQNAAEDFKRAIHLDPQKKNRAANRARLLVSIVQDALSLAKQNGISALEEAGKKLRSKK